MVRGKTHAYKPVGFTLLLIGRVAAKHVLGWTQEALTCYVGH